MQQLALEKSVLLLSTAVLPSTCPAEWSASLVWFSLSASAALLSPVHNSWELPLPWVSDLANTKNQGGSSSVAAI